METASREVLWNVSSQWVLYPCLAIAVGLCAFFLYRRWRMCGVGAPQDRSGDRAKRLLGVVKDSLLQVTVLKDRVIGINHVLMYACMLVMLVATASVALQADFGLPIVQGAYYLYFLSLATDIAGGMFCVVMVALIVRRVLRRNSGVTSTWSDYLILALLFVMGVTGFILEGLRIYETADPWAAWSPIGNLFSYLFVGMSSQTALLAHKVLWYFHMILAFGLMATWAYTKLVHVFLIPVAVYYRNLDNPGTLPAIDCEDETLETFGAGHLTDLTWKDLLDSQACIRCGRCERSCPAFATGKALSPMALMQGIYGEMCAYDANLRAAAKAGAAAGGDVAAAGAAAGGGVAATDAAAGGDASPAIVEQKPLVGTAISADALWSCTTCGACMQVCPALLEHTPKIVKMRTFQTSMESDFPQVAQTAFRGMENNGNPWGLGWKTRDKWTRNLDVPVPTLGENPDAEYLYWPGCSGAFDSRNRKVTAAMVNLLNQAQVSWAILGNEEKCCGDAARRLGNEFVYYTLAMENIETLKAYGVKKIITQCPHCYQTLTVDYPQLGGEFEVIHHSQFLSDLVAQGRLQAAAAGTCGSADAACGSVTFHDSCYLGRYNHIYEQPRDVVAATGATLVEMDRCREKSFCCGAGGGQMWLEEMGDARINAVRAHEALVTGADVIATGCPFCLTMLSDGVAAAGSEVPVKDIAELLWEAQPSYQAR